MNNPLIVLITWTRIFEWIVKPALPAGAIIIEKRMDCCGVDENGKKWFFTRYTKEREFGRIIILEVEEDSNFREE